jgi:aminoglycoside phosphotransferase (APT) family kinase protein
MTATLTLPRNIQLKLEQTLTQWPQWRCEPPLVSPPEVINLLVSGVSNFSVLVRSGQRFVVRIDGINPAANGLNRQSEWRALYSAHSASRAPRPCYFNPALGSLVCDYLSPDEEQGLCIGELAALLRDIHQLPARHSRLDLAERILRYEKQLEHRGQALTAPMAQCREPVLRMLDDINRRPQPAVLCHNDLLQANRIYSGGRLWAIDWEYCAMGSPWYDLAVVITGDSLGAAQADELLEAYLGRTATSAERLELQQHSCVYRYLELLWYLAQQRTAPEPALLEQKMAALEKALQFQGTSD